MIGVEEGGLHSAEALLLARYFMSMQVYYHPVRRVYDIHLQDFLREWLPGNAFDANVERHLAVSDVEVTRALREACLDEEAPGHEHAKRILQRGHFKVLYARNPDDIKRNPDAVNAIYDAAVKRFGAESVRRDAYARQSGTLDFPVEKRDGRIVSSLAESQALWHFPVATTGYVFVCRERWEEAGGWLRAERERILGRQEEEDRE